MSTPLSKELSGACTGCYGCGLGIAACVAKCGKAATTKNPWDIAQCAICVLGAPIAAGPCVQACYNCMAADRIVACQNYDAWSREMCTTEQWVCCNGISGCTSCAPYGGYCPSDTMACGYGSRETSPCDDGGFDFLQVVRRPGIRVEDMVERESPRAKADAGDVEARRFRSSRNPWRQWGASAVYKTDCDGDGPPGGGGGGGDDGGGGGDDTYCTHCSCQGEFTSWEGEVCGSTTEQLVDQCWDSCY